MFVVPYMTNRANYGVVDIATGTEVPGFEIRRRRDFPIVPEARPSFCTTGAGSLYRW
jgi:hypothetical protein